MHIVHLAETTNSTSPILYAAVGIMFSVEEFDKSITAGEQAIIDRFISHLKFGQLGNPVVDQVAFGEIMKLVNYEARWTYHGSLTTPPCSPFIYWNVIRRVFPIKAAELEKFKEML